MNNVASINIPFGELARQMDVRLIKNTLKRAYRAEGKKVRQLALQSLHSTGLNVDGNKSDWDKGVRLRIYSKGGGFMVSVKGSKGRSMHVNRQGLQKPVLMWAEGGTKQRRTKSKTRFFKRLRKQHSTGSMPAYRFLERVTPQSYQMVERDLFKEVEQAAFKVAMKAGMI